MLHYFSVLLNIFFTIITALWSSITVLILFVFIKAGTATTIATGLTLGKDLIWILMLYSQK